MHVVLQFTRPSFPKRIWDYLLGTLRIQGLLTVASSLHFLQDELPFLLENIELWTRKPMWFLNYGAPPHFSADVWAVD